jgi:hypothetical protein
MTQQEAGMTQQEAGKTPVKRTIHSRAKQFIAFIFGSPEHDRLAGAIAETKADLDQQTANPAAEVWSSKAEKFLEQAQAHLVNWNLQQGWVSLMSAQRAILSNPDDTGRLRRAVVVLRREAEKVTGWRAAAIGDLLREFDEKGRINPEKVERQGFQKNESEESKKNESEESKKSASQESKKSASQESKGSESRGSASDFHERGLDAIALLNDQANTTYFKILLRRRSLFQLFVILWLAIAICLILSAEGRLPPPFHEWPELAAVVLFGVLGATLSVALGLMASDVSAKIPAQLIGSFVVWMRPGIGAVAALVAFALIRGGFLDWLPKNENAVWVVAFAAGFSERFIVGAIDKVAPTDDKKH